MNDDNDVEVFAVQGPPPEIIAQQWAMWHATVRELSASGGLTPAGYQSVRVQLRTGAWREGLVPDGFAGQRVLLLDHVCDALAQIRPGLDAYYRGAGDMLPGAPDFPDFPEVEGV